MIPSVPDLSTASPSRAVTLPGLANLTTELSGKQLETLREVLPKLSRLAVLRDLTEPGNPQAVRETDRTARAFNIERHYLDVRVVMDIEPAFAAAAKKHIEALLVLPSAVFNSNRKEIVDLAVQKPMAGNVPEG
jgi:putative ABC transport system substrate-binding protein